MYPEELDVLPEKLAEFIEKLEVYVRQRRYPDQTFLTKLVDYLSTILDSSFLTKERPVWVDYLTSALLTARNMNFYYNRYSTIKASIILAEVLLEQLVKAYNGMQSSTGIDILPTDLNS